LLNNSKLLNLNIKYLNKMANFLHQSNALGSALSLMLYFTYENIYSVIYIYKKRNSKETKRLVHNSLALTEYIRILRLIYKSSKPLFST